MSPGVGSISGVLAPWPLSRLNGHHSQPRVLFLLRRIGSSNGDGTRCGEWIDELGRWHLLLGTAASLPGMRTPSFRCIQAAILIRINSHLV